MKTLTVSKARQKLGYWCKRAAKGEEIGIIVGDRLIALREVPIEAGDYAEREYGLTREEIARAAKRIHADAGKQRQSGDLMDLEDFGNEFANKTDAPRAENPRQTKRRSKGGRSGGAKRPS